MANYISKKKNKLNTYKAVRESIQLNKSNSVTIDLGKNLINDDHLIFQLTNINLTNHLNNQKLSKKDKLIVKWWEN